MDGKQKYSEKKLAAHHAGRFWRQNSKNWVRRLNVSNWNLVICKAHIHSQRIHYERDRDRQRERGDGGKRETKTIPAMLLCTISLTCVCTLPIILNNGFCESKSYKIFLVCAARRFDDFVWYAFVPNFALASIGDENQMNFKRLMHP